MTIRTLGLCTLALAALFIVTPASAASLRVCNASAGTISHVIFDPDLSGASFSSNPMSGLQGGQCLNVSNIVDGAYKLLLVRGANCSFRLSISGSTVFMFDHARADKCDADFNNTLDIFDDE